MPFQVRDALHADSPRISQIAAQTFALACPANTPPAEITAFIQDQLQVEHFNAALDDPEQQLRVLVHQGQVIGYSLVKLRPQALGIAEADQVPELTRCYLAADFHGSGGAQYLLQQTLESLTQPIRLTVSEANARAIRFYQRNGFINVGETTFQCGADLHRDWVMLRQPPATV
ncbi:GNAT family N-acetyltransferase [Pseudomonas sp. TH05]|uniref:GNAT family N-acetyltransferase n=1 Tax=unclassified Pseudomonas TaxID=196821 RepID=UPI0019115609|nr:MULTISPECIES: GNAT family N-acetyltransferase [unclassified Pseudomonas]MBK5540608.1 GNAT family N-acetyltransferase [Pseudomonas sp. TH07]MBK5556496.1 GNAT family N-acetyltransferase [Pseudomonas sp. TH05]